MKPLGPRTQWTLNAIAISIQPLNGVAFWSGLIGPQWAMITATGIGIASGILMLAVTGVRLPAATR